jgi:hypothetical protein
VSSSARGKFWARHPGLVWSNPQAEDTVYIRAALVRPRFRQILEIIMEFGLERVKAEWAELCSEPDSEVDRARPIVCRIFKNIEEGIALAASRD